METSAGWARCSRVATPRAASRRSNRATPSTPFPPPKPGIQAQGAPGGGGVDAGHGQARLQRQAAARHRQGPDREARQGLTPQTAPEESLKAPARPNGAPTREPFLFGPYTCHVPQPDQALPQCGAPWSTACPTMATPNPAPSARLPHRPLRKPAQRGGHRARLGRDGEQVLLCKRNIEPRRASGPCRPASWNWAKPPPKARQRETIEEAGARSNGGCSR
jgi:hypothetical protein